MRAMVVSQTGPAEVLRLAEIPEPKPGEGEVATDIAYAGVGFVDTLFRGGAFSLPVPFVPGIEVKGRIRALGPGVTGLTVGQHAAALLLDFERGSNAGGYAEVAVARADLVTALPENSDLAQAAALLVNGVTAWRASARTCPR